MTAQNTLDEIQNLRMSTASKVDIQTAIEQMEDVVQVQERLQGELDELNINLHDKVNIYDNRDELATKVSKEDLIETKNQFDNAIQTSEKKIQALHKDTVKVLEQLDRDHKSDLALIGNLEKTKSGRDETAKALSTVKNDIEVFILDMKADYAGRTKDLEDTLQERHDLTSTYVQKEIDSVKKSISDAHERDVRKNTEVNS